MRSWIWTGTGTILIVGATVGATAGATAKTGVTTGVTATQQQLKQCTLPSQGNCSNSMWLFINTTDFVDLRMY